MNIVVLDGYTLNPGDLSWSGLQSLATTTIYDRTPAEEVVRRAKDADIILTNKTIITNDIMEALPSLKYIGVLATGYNVVDLNAAIARGIEVTNIPAYSTNSVAQMVFAMILEVTNAVGLHNSSVHNGDWNESIDFSYWLKPVIELSGKTLGIIGFGSIGKKTAEIANAFGMKTLVHTRTIPDGDFNSLCTFTDLDTLLKTSDIVSIHCPLTDKTNKMVNSEFLSKMKASAILINTARGPIVDEDALANALNNGVIAAAALDVLEVEPPSILNPMLVAKNCYLTPHISWASIEARGRLMSIAVANVKSFLEGKVQNSVFK